MNHRSCKAIKAASRRAAGNAEKIISRVTYMEDQIKKNRLAEECENLDIEFEQELAEEIWAGESTWWRLEN